MAKPETNFIFGEYRGLLRYRSITQWAVTLEVSTNAISRHIEAGRDFQSFVDRHHNEEAWEMWSKFCYA